MHNCLRDLAFVEYGKSPNEVRDQNGIYPIYGTGGLVGTSNRFLFDQNAIVVARKGTLDNPTYVEGEYWIIDTAYATIPRDNIDAKWLYYCLSNYDLRKLNEATGVPSISRDYLYRVEFYTPSLPQQQKIAKILTTIDNLIEQTQALIDKYTAIKQGMMADLFTRGIDLSGTPETNPNHGQLRPSFEEAPELYKETELGWVPKEWEAEPLANYLSIITYGFTNPMPEANDGPWMVTAANVINGSIDYKRTRKTTFEAFNNLLTDKSRPLKGDILLTKDGTLGRLAIVDNENICINQSVALLRTNSKSSPHFIKTLLETENYQKKMLDDAGGSAIKHIYITVVDKMKITVPKNIEEQQEIFRRADVLLNKMQCEHESLEKFKLIKKGLMQDLLTGKVQATT